MRDRISLPNRPLLGSRVVGGIAHGCAGVNAETSTSWSRRRRRRALLRAGGRCAAVRRSAPAREELKESRIPIRLRLWSPACAPASLDAASSPIGPDLNRSVVAQPRDRIHLRAGQALFNAANGGG